MPLTKDTSGTKTILITGGSGFIGQALTKEALARGYKVHWMSRDVTSPVPDGVKVFGWNVNNKSMDHDAWAGVTHVVHLAGANIGERSWSRIWKDAVIKSRIRSNAVLSGYAPKYANRHLEAVVLASGVGFYGTAGKDHIWTETEGPGTGFQAEVCIKWETAIALSFENLGARAVTLRTGVVLNPKGGALAKMIPPVKLGIGSLGNGKQWVSWISLRDHVNLILFALENPEMSGTYNAVAPNPVTNAALTKVIAKSYKAFTLLPMVPAFLIRLFVGEMSELVLGSIRCSADKVLATGFKFGLPTLTKIDEEM